jgi:hypothetical protein
MGFAIALILVMPMPSSKETKQHAGALNIPVYRVWREQELEMV